MFHRFHSEGFGVESKARDVIIQCDGTWPQNWVNSNPHAFDIPVPLLDDGENDTIQWIGTNHAGIDFNVRDAWRSLDGEHELLPWTRYVWFKGHIPKHAMCMWTACHYRLPTQDRIGLWKENPPDMLCPLCENCSDSHDHLFFTCAYARQVWRNVKREVDLWGFPDSWNLIMEMLRDGRGPGRRIQRLALSASIYFIWRERNSRLFRSNRQPSIQTFKVIRHAILARMAGTTVGLKP